MFNRSAHVHKEKLKEGTTRSGATAPTERHCADKAPVRHQGATHKGSKTKSPFCVVLKTYHLDTWILHKTCLKHFNFLNRKTVCPIVFQMEHHGNSNGTGNRRINKQVETRFKNTAITSKNYGADQQRLQISDLHFDKLSTPPTFACWKIRFKTEVCTCSQFVTEAMHWIKEVEMVDSVDDIKSSSSLGRNSNARSRSTRARIASALNRIIHTSHFKKKGQSGGTKSPKGGPFLSRKTDCLLDL